MKRDFDIISLDIETSGTDPEKHALLSIGCVRLSDLESFYAEVIHKELLVSPESFRVHGLDIRNIDGRDSTGGALPEIPNPGKRLSVEQTDQELFNWLKSDKFYREGKKYTLIPMGMNVGSFDMQFVRKWLPKTFALFGYRSIDLNSLIFLDSVRSETDFYTLKKAAKALGRSYALAKCPEEYRQAHNALYDAFSNVGVFTYVGEDLCGTKIAMGEMNWEGGNLNG